MSEPAFDFFLTRRYKVAVSLSLGLFLYGFMLLFLPFGVSNYNPRHEYTWEFLREMTHFLGMTLALALACEFLLKPLLLRRASLAGILLWNAFLLLVQGLGNFLLYNWLGDWHDFHLGSALGFIGNCASVLVFPLVGTFFYFRYRALNERLARMQVRWRDDPAPERLIHFQGQGSSDRLSVAAADFRYAQAQDNYVALFYFRNGALKKELIRASLTELLDQARSADLVRCHRSYVVNLRQVRSFSGGHPLELYLNGVEAPIRVSRSYREAILGRLSTASEPT